MAGATKAKLPADVLAAVRRYLLLQQEEFHALDSEFQSSLARANPADGIALLERYCVKKLDVFACWAMRLSESNDPGAINPAFKLVLQQAARKTLAFCDEALRHVRQDIRDDTTSRIRLRIQSRVSDWLAKANARHFERHPAPVIELPKAVTRVLIKHRRGLLRRHRSEHELTAVGFARKAGMSPSTISGIVTENRQKFSPEKQAKLLALIGISRTKWYREP